MQRITPTVQLFAAAFIGMVAAGGLSAKSDAADPHIETWVAPLARSLVWVEYRLRFHDGEAPRGIGWGEVCPNCGRIHGNPLEQRMLEERTIRVPGFVIAQNRVLTPDFMTHPRFIREIHVTAETGLYAAHVLAYRQDAPGMILAAEALDAMPLPSFDAEGQAPFVAMRRAFLNGVDQVVLSEVPGRPLTVLADGRSFTSIAPGSLIADPSGRPIGITLSGELDLDGSWKGHPLQGTWLDSDALQAKQAKLTEIVTHGFVPVTLHFRSPPAKPGESHLHSVRSYFPPRSHVVDENTTEHHATGLVIAPDRVLVIVGIPPALTARLERIRIHLPDGERISGTFVGSFRDFKALLIEPQHPLSEVLAIEDAHAHTFRRQLVFGVEIHLQPDYRETHVGPLRLESFGEGFRNQVQPSLENASPHLFVFHGTRLLAMPVQRRDRMRALQGARSHRFSQVQYQPLAYWREILDHPAPAFDTANRPTGEDTEMQLAWIGVELQPMSHELALAHAVMRQTENGQRGAIISHVYDDSPAASQGLKIGDILLWAETECLPAPVQIRIDSASHSRQIFQWERLDRMSPQHFDQIPAPWPEIRNRFNLMLTQLGEGTFVEISYIRDGQLRVAAFTIEQGPETFESTKRYVHQASGVTVRNQTYEVRNFLQISPDEPGVILSRVEPGSKAAVAGIRPFERITHVDDQPVLDVSAFEQLMDTPGDKQLTIRRMASSRLVRIAE